MIHKPLTEIDVDDIKGLIVDAVAEGKTIEYKSELPGGSERDVKEFLADVSSFANTVGGDMVFGLAEEGGVPTEIVGFADLDEDEVKQRLENLIRDGLEPRFSCDIRRLSLDSGRSLVIIRTRRSWLAPHRVTYRGHDRFYARNSAGKYPMDTTELRTAFTFGDRVTQQIRVFVRDRLADIASDTSPVLLRSGPKIVLHLVPLEAFGPESTYPVLDLRLDQLVPIYSYGGLSRRINLDGMLVYSTDDQGTGRTYVQAYRNGIIEAVEGSLLRDENKRIPSLTFEKELLNGVGRYLAIMRGLAVAGPVNIRLALLGVKGYRMGVDVDMEGPRNVCDRENLVLPDTLIEDLTQNADEVMRPLLDLIWNACGYPRSPNFDAGGKWVGKRSR